jgi:hypothetical protein
MGPTMQPTVKTRRACREPIQEMFDGVWVKSVPDS